LENSPWARNIVENNPEMRQVLESPETIQLFSDIMRNPSLRDEFIRNSDRAISQLENIPGGFNVLHRIHNQIGDPYESLFQNNNTQNNETPQEEHPPPTSLSGAPLPNPWTQNNNRQNNQGNNLNFPFNFNNINQNQQTNTQNQNQNPFF